jgi:succinyl-CoA synthetase beta subunit
MRLYEYEAKDLLRSAQIEAPRPLQLDTLERLNYTQPCVLKAQVLFGNRMRKGLIQPVLNGEAFPDAVNIIRGALGKSHSSQTSKILIEPLIKYGPEMYLAIRYDTRTRRPALYFDPQGGTGIEERGRDTLINYPLAELEESIPPALHSDLHPDWVASLIKLFFANDLTLLEINPLVIFQGRPIALDAKIELEDAAAFRHPQWQEYPPRTLFEREPSANEQRAKAVNAMDHRGAAGASYFDFPGSVGILASGGGASLLAMDALLASGLRPANYTEYSGNPSREKVRALAEIVLSQPNLDGLWVVGGHANFTDIYETLMGVMDAVESAKLPPGFPVIIRRGGPRTQEAFAALRERAPALKLHLELFDSSFPITDTVCPLIQGIWDFRKARH